MGKGQSRAPRTALRSNMLDDGRTERVTVAIIEERVWDIPRGEICWMSRIPCCQLSQNLVRLN